MIAGLTETLPPTVIGVPSLVVWITRSLNWWMNSYSPENFGPSMSTTEPSPALALKSCTLIVASSPVFIFSLTPTAAAVEVVFSGLLAPRSPPNTSDASTGVKWSSKLAFASFSSAFSVADFQIGSSPSTERADSPPVDLLCFGPADGPPAWLHFASISPVTEAPPPSVTYETPFSYMNPPSTVIFAPLGPICGETEMLPVVLPPLRARTGPTGVAGGRGAGGAGARGVAVTPAKRANAALPIAEAIAAFAPSRGGGSCAGTSIGAAGSLTRSGSATDRRYCLDHARVKTRHRRAGQGRTA